MSESNKPEIPCIVYTMPDGRLSYATYTTDLESSNIQKGLVTQGFVLFGAMSLPDALRLINAAAQPTQVPPASLSDDIYRR